LLIAVLVTELRKEVNYLDVLAFDELSAPRITVLTKKMVSRLLKSNKKAYVKIAKEASEEASEDIKELTGIAVKPLKTDEAFIATILAAYNPTTGYVYENEADRKRARLAEALIAAVIAGLRLNYRKELKKFANLWHTQTKQYAISVVDNTRIETFRKNGIRRVRWETQKDERVCAECGARDGKIFDIDKLPEKHYGCRCWLMPVLEKTKGNNGES
jgi:SPP1 gp7 family putative phage head morphogenesis protein